MYRVLYILLYLYNWWIGLRLSVCRTAASRVDVTGRMPCVLYNFCYQSSSLTSPDTRMFGLVFFFNFSFITLILTFDFVLPSDCSMFIHNLLLRSLYQFQKKRHHIIKPRRLAVRYVLGLIAKMIYLLRYLAHW